MSQPANATIQVAAFYHFADLPDFANLQQPLKECGGEEVKGTILLAAEGVNGTIAGPEDKVQQVLALLRAQAPLASLQAKFSWSDHQPFYRYKVRLKKEIVTLGQPQADPRKQVGTYVDPAQWNALLADPDVVVVDTRNDYEVQVGTFPGAINPETDSFREFPEYVHQNLSPEKNKKVAMFCTGGIRCEKASAYMLAEGYEEVYHLEGGILKYLETVKPDQNQWQGECFVFDNRVTVDAQLNPGTMSICHGCRRPLAPEDLRHADYEKGVRCGFCSDEITAEQLASRRERQKQVELAAQQGKQHIGEQ